MTDQNSSNTVIVVTACSEAAKRTVERLSDSGFSVIGPVDRANVALALAAQSPLDLAVVDSELAGDRSGPDLARDLMTAWGAPTILVDSDRTEHDGAAEWRAACALSDRVRAVLADPPAPPESVAA